MPAGIRLPPSLIQTPTEHHTVGGTPLGLAFGAISLGIFVFAALLSLRKKIPLWRVGTVQRWLRAHIWLTLLTIPLILLHSGFRLGGPMTTLLMALYAIVMVSGIYGLVLQHLMPRLMKERLPAETVFEQIPHIRAQLCVAAEKMRDSFKPAPPKKPDAGAPAPSPAKTATAAAAVMASTKGELSTPVARAKSATGSAVTAEPVAAAAATTTAAPAAKAAEAAADAGDRLRRKCRGHAGSSAKPARRSALRRRECKANRPALRFRARRFRRATNRRRIHRLFPQLRRLPLLRKNQRPPPAPPHPRQNRRVTGRQSQPLRPPQSPPLQLPQNPRPRNPRPRRRNLRLRPTRHRKRRWSNSSIARFFPTSRRDAASGSAWATPRFSDDTFRFVKLRVAETYRSRVEEIQGWCDERRMLDLQTRLHHWLHGWLFIHVPFSFLLLMLTIWHAYVTLFYY